MSACPQCGATVSPGSHSCPNCGARVIFHHVPHPHIAKRKEHAPFKGRDLLPGANAFQRFNSRLAVRITAAVGTMWCAYLFAILACFNLPEAIRGGTSTLIPWIAQTFLQLVLLSIIIVGQKVDSAASDKRALDTYNDAEAVLHEAMQIQEHLSAQDRVLNELIGELRQTRRA
jgi:hypothetical protein